MSKYTTEVRYICEVAAGVNESACANNVDEIIDAAIPKIFDFEFPIFDEAYRGVLCKKILKHFYTREICEETVGLWKLRLNTKLNEIMPYYNQLYKSELLDFNPMYNTEITTSNKGTRKSESETKAEANNTGTERNLYSDTPQGGLQNLESENYLTNARKIISDDTSKGTSNGLTNTFDDYITVVSGKQGGESFSKILQEFRETFLNIDMLVIQELNTLFFTLW